MTDDIIPEAEWVEAFPTEQDLYETEAYKRWLMEQEVTTMDWIE